MDNEITQRLEIMLNAEMINQGDIDCIHTVTGMLEASFGIPVTGSQGNMFVSHVAMMLRRTRMGDDISPMSEPCLSSLHKEPVYPLAVRIEEALAKRCGVVITENEKLYVTMHICSLILNAEADKNEA